MPDLNHLIGNESAFPSLRKWDFYNHAGVAPLPHVAAEALRAYATQAEDGAYLETQWYKEVEALRSAAAVLMNASRDEIALVKNTSEGIATIAAGLDWEPGERIVTTDVEYPANIYPWLDVARRIGLDIVMVPEQTSPDGRRRVPIDEILEAAANPYVRLVALSHVEFASGQRHDLARIGAFCREQNKLLFVDGIQSLGVLPVDVKAMNIDFLSADGHKWLLGPEGAGLLYIRRELLPKVRPLLVGWMNMVNAMDYGNYDLTFRPDAAKYECGSWNVPGFLALKASLDLLQSVGTENIAGRLKVLTNRLIAGLERKGYAIISPRDVGEWSGIVSFTTATHDQNEIVHRMKKEHRIELVVREGRLRASPHFYMTEQQIDRLIETLPGP